jgi:biopolymer transport protein ExbD
MDIGGRKKGARAEINITPLIDVVLVLLIIFMVLKQTTLNKLTANVPRKDTAQEPQQPQSQIVLTVKPGGELVLGDRRLAPDALGREVADQLSRDVHKAVFFQIEDGVPYGEAIRVMDVVKGAGARVLAIITKE